MKPGIKPNLNYFKFLGAIGQNVKPENSCRELNPSSKLLRLRAIRKKKNNTAYYSRRVNRLRGV